MSTSTPMAGNQPPYEVVKQTFQHRYNADGTQGAEYTVHIKHKNGTHTHFTLPEEHYTAMNAHVAAMKQVAAVQEVANLPGSAVQQMAKAGVQ